MSTGEKIEVNAINPKNKLDQIESACLNLNSACYINLSDYANCLPSDIKWNSARSSLQNYFQI